MEEELKGKYPPDIFWPPGERSLVEFDRLKQTKLYQLSESVYDTFAYDERHGIVGWWNADARTWFEIWAIRVEHQGPMERWTYFPKTYEGEPIPLPPSIDLVNEPPRLVSSVEVPYNVLKRLAMLADKELGS